MTDEPTQPPRSPYLEQFKHEVNKALEGQRAGFMARLDVQQAQISRVNKRIDTKMARHNRKFHERPTPPQPAADDDNVIFPPNASYAVTMRPIDPTNPDLVRVVVDCLFADGIQSYYAETLAPRILSALAVAIGGEK